MRLLRSVACLTAIVVLPGAASAQKLKVEITKAVKHDLSPPLRDIKVPYIAHAEKREIHRPKPLPLHGSGPTSDPVVQAAPGGFAATTVGGFEGLGDANYDILYSPPDTTGAAGSTQYAQFVNVAFAVFDKNTGEKLLGPLNGNTLFNNFGGPCEANNDGDPIVLYDKAANRWLLSQFSVSGGVYYQCIAISTTDDATGSYYRYAFQFNQFNDYPKFGVWPDGYYASFNMFTSTFQGARVCAYDRAKMLTGAAATTQCVQLSSSFGGLLPSDLDGSSQPPAGSPNYFLNYGTNSLRIWKFHVDWTTPANSSFTGPTTLSVASFTRACATTSGGACIPQPGTSQKLDSLADRLMYRLAYRNFGTYESLVVNHSVSAGGTKKAPSTGVRWYELRKSGSGNFAVHQQGTYAPDGAARWMGSIAMDKLGNIALGYSVSSSSIQPSIRYTSRNAGDTLGTMGAEAQIIAGTGSQLRNLNRWGDYSHMSIDPTDDCTMYYATEYLANNGTWNWHTFVGKIKNPGCN
jgi:hypothetical protein